MTFEWIINSKFEYLRRTAIELAKRSMSPMHGATTILAISLEERMCMPRSVKRLYGKSFERSAKTRWWVSPRVTLLELLISLLELIIYFPARALDSPSCSKSCVESLLDSILLLQLKPPRRRLAALSSVLQSSWLHDGTYLARGRRVCVWT